MNLVTPPEHPFAVFVRILGKGKRGARDLTRDEAREAMGMLLDGKVEDTQLGAFLMLLRHKEESAEELAGFTEAVRERLHAPGIVVDIDWPTYAGEAGVYEPDAERINAALRLNLTRPAPRT